MERIAKIFISNKNQAVRLPKDFQFDTDEVFIRRDGENVILSPKPSSWKEYLNHGTVAPDDFMTAVNNLTVQERHQLEYTK